MLICRNAKGINGKRKVGNPCAMQTSPATREVTGQFAPLNFSKACLVIRCNKSDNNFASPENISWLRP